MIGSPLTHNCMGKSAEIKYIADDFAIEELDHASWETAREIKTKSYWSGQRAPKRRKFVTQMLWSDSALYVRFKANQGERPVISGNPDLTKKSRGLWQRDVCELFVAPNPEDVREYYEFEIAPTGEWIDLRIRQEPDERFTDSTYKSGMRTAAMIEYDLITSAFKVGWKAFGVKPKEGDIWKGNLLRAVGRGKTRGFLAWSATRTEEPNFHVPERFGDLEFVK